MDLDIEDFRVSISMVCVSRTGRGTHSTREQIATTIPTNSWSVGSSPKKATASMAVRSMALEVEYTFTIVSAYFCSQETKSPLKEKLITINTAIRLYLCIQKEEGQKEGN